VEAPLTSAASTVEEWTGHGVDVGSIERRLVALRESVEAETEGPDLRTSVMTHMAWVPPDWLQAATETLAGLAERHPSRTILLVPEPDAGDDRLDAELSMRCFPLPGQAHHVCSEVIELHLRGKRAVAPGSIVEPLLVADLPVFLRWRGEPPFAAPQFEQLADVAGRLVVDSGEWSDLPAAYGALTAFFDRVAVSDIAWSRGLGWRRSLAALWPAIKAVEELRVAGPLADALLLACWLRSRLGRQIELVHEDCEELELVAVDGEPARVPNEEPRKASDLLSEELDNFGRDPVYEEAVRSAGRRSGLS